MTLPTIVNSLDIAEDASTWPATAFSLTAGASLLIFGRLADMFGAQKVYLLGLSWYVVWSLIAGFAVNQIMLDIARAMQGFGPAAFLTSGMGLLGSVYGPGRRKNIVFAIYSGTAPIGFFLGIILGGVTSQSLTWRWYFWIGTILSAVALVGGVFTIPWNFQPRVHEDSALTLVDTSKDSKTPSMDYWGASSFFIGAFLITFSLTDSAHAPEGWRTPYVPILWVLGWLILFACVIYEIRLAVEPLLPLHILKMPRISWLLLAIFLMFGTLGIWLFYTTTYLQNVLQLSPLTVVAWFIPFSLGGIILSVIGGYCLDKIPGFILFILSGAAWIIATLLPAIAPVGANYWPWFFPTMICATLGVDVSYLVASVFLTSTMDEREQGLASGVFNSLQFLGISIWLGFADLTVSQYASRGLRSSYQCAFWLGLGCAAAALAIIVLFVRTGRAGQAEVVEEKKSSQDIEGAAATREHSRPSETHA